jgi:hypothetical protein
LCKQFAAEREMRAEIALHEPAAERMVALAWRWIQHCGSNVLLCNDIYATASSRLCFETFSNG